MGNVTLRTTEYVGEELTICTETIFELFQDFQAWDKEKMRAMQDNYEQQQESMQRFKDIFKAPKDTKH